jgi:hypothetical protein
MLIVTTPGGKKAATPLERGKYWIRSALESLGRERYPMDYPVELFLEFSLLLDGEQ